ncbi:MAG: radical SAM protein [Desulfobacterales bacterium]|nr:radical SAM protein [Desulfobacterales bacterium]
MKKPSPFLTAVVANTSGEIFDLAGYAAVGADGPLRAPLEPAQTRNLPHGSELMFLPDRVPLVYDLGQDRLISLPENPHAPGEAIFPVAAFNSPGYLLTHTCAYEERPRAGFLPLFSYGAVGWQRGKFRSAVLQVDDEPRQDLRQMPLDKIKAGVKRMRRQLPDNRLRAHLEKCALTYGCPAGKNFFLARYEAPLPASPACNARCLGCISLQSEGTMPCSQERIAFTPSPEEIAGVALAHIQGVPNAVVSFGQGCEGDPLMGADTLCDAVRLVRAQTRQGTINMNTNGSLPDKIGALIEAGLDSVRISLNSVRQPCYEAYYRPKGYAFQDVLTTIDLALGRGAHVAINYLNCPGFSDAPEERDALLAFLQAHPIQLIQWRNLNFDPLRYLGIMNQVAPLGRPLGVRALFEEVSRAFPRLHHGYFNPPREKF